MAADFTPPDPADWSVVERVIDEWGRRLQEREAEQRPALGLHSLNDPTEMQSAEDLFWKLPE
jgi:hypothetical protein